MQYESYYGPFAEEWTARDIEAAIERNDPGELLYVLLIVSMAPRSRIWSEQICLRLTTNADTAVRGNAFEGFGHLARIYRMLNRRLVEPVLLRDLIDEQQWVRMKTQDAIDDIEGFLGWVFPGREDRRLREVRRSPAFDQERQGILLSKQLALEHGLAGEFCRNAVVMVHSPMMPVNFVAKDVGLGNGHGPARVGLDQFDLILCIENRSPFGRGIAVVHGRETLARKLWAGNLTF